MFNSIRRSGLNFVLLLALILVVAYQVQDVKAVEDLKRSFEALHMTEAKQLVSRIHELIDEVSEGKVERLIRSQTRKLVLLILNDAIEDSLEKKISRLEEGKLFACKDQNESCESVFSEEIDRIRSGGDDEATEVGTSKIMNGVGLVALANRLAIKEDLS